MKVLMLIGIGGFAGSVLRYVLSMAMLPLYLRTGFPSGTLAVNVAGSLLIGVMASLLKQDAWYYLGAVGFCGGFTTFSTFSLEMVNMFKAGNTTGAVLYILLSLALSAAAAVGGLWIGAKFR